MNESEHKAVNAFIEKHQECYIKAKKDSQFRIKMKSTGMGYSVKIKCCSCGQKENVTDYNSW